MPSGKDSPEWDDPLASKPKEPGEFTRAFGGGDQPKPDPFFDAAEKSESGSLTQQLGKPAPPSPPAIEPPKTFTVPPSSAPAQPTSSFTKAFDGVNAFTRDLGNLGDQPLTTQFGNRPPSPDKPSSAAGSFTRLFGAGDGILTPAGPDSQSSNPFAQRKPHDFGPTGMSKSPDFAPPQPSPFTEAFPAPAATPPRAPNDQAGSFTEQFGPSSFKHDTDPFFSPPRSETHSRGGAPMGSNRNELFPPENPPQPASPEGGFTRLISPTGSEPTPSFDSTRISVPPTRTDRPISDPRFRSRPDTPLNETIAFKPSRAEPEFQPPEGKSEYTMVIKGPRARPSGGVPGGGVPNEAAGGAPAGAMGAGLPVPPAGFPVPAPPQYPPMPQPPAWPPAAMPPQQQPAWPHVAPPPMPQPPAPPQLGAAPPLPSAGDRLIQFLPLILTLSIINTLGLIALLIIVFATRK